LIDLPPEELLTRLAEGKVYVPEQARRAMERFFNRGNLIALRGLALRQTAERVDADMGAYRRAHGIEQTWAVTDRILVGVSPSPYSARLVRTACRMARSLHVPWLAVYVETTTQADLSPAAKQRLSQNLRLAEQLGAETLTITGLRAAPALLELARERNVTKIVVGKPRRGRWRERAPGAFVSELMLDSGDIDILVTSGEETAAAPAAPAAPSPRRERIDWLGYLAALAMVGAATVAGSLLRGRKEPADAAMLYLLAVVIISARRGAGPALATGVLGVLAFDFFFIPPFLSFSVADVAHILTFSVMILVAVVISSLAGRLRAHAEKARERERRTALLYGLSRALADAADQASAVEVAVTRLGQVFDGQAGIKLADRLGLMDFAAETPPSGAAPLDEGIVRWTWENLREAGSSTDTMAGAKGLYLPLQTSRRPVGVLAVFPRNEHLFHDPEQRRLLDAFASQIALALERFALAEQTQRARLAVEQERLRGTLLSSVSHDLRTPLAAITGAASALWEDRGGLSTATRLELLATIHEEARRLNRLVRNLLDMTRLESGAVEIKREWQPLEEVVGAAIRRLEEQLAGRAVNVSLAPDLPPAPIDGLLIEQALVNLLENAVKYTPAGAPIDIVGRRSGGAVALEVADRGEGIAPGEERRIFEKFYRSPRAGASGGVGLGLAICQAIAAAHGGDVSAENRPGGGALFRLTLPIVGAPPKLDNDEPAGAA
jgi:two-component system sensor histidine kinase KdpD